MSIAASIDFRPRPRSFPTDQASESSALRACPALADLPPAALTALATGSAARRLARRESLAAEGTAPAAVFVVVKGRVRAVRRAASGREVTVETLRPGSILADAVLAPGRALPHAWEAAEATELLSIPAETFTAAVEGTPAIAAKLGAEILARLYRSHEAMASLALADVQGRVIAALRQLAESDGRESPEGIMVQNRPTQQELANQIGACRETVSRVVSDLARRRMITARGRALLIHRALMSDT